MNHTEIISSESSKSWLIVFVLLIGLLLGSLKMNAQSLSKRTVFNEQITSDYIINDFKVKEINNKLYFKFLVLENQYNTTYTLESSTNGKDFYAVQLKEGFKSPNGTPLLYCYTVDLNQLNDKSYRIRRDSDDGKEYSTVINLNNVVSPSLSAQNN